MCKPIKLTIEGKPVSVREKAIAGKRMYNKKKLVDWMNYVSLMAKQAMKGRDPLLGAVHMNLTIYRHVPTSWNKKRTSDALKGYVFPVTTPDRSNHLKPIEDALNGIVYGDDSQIVSGMTNKRYAERDYVEIEVWSLGFENE